MNAYEKMLKIIREQGRSGSPFKIALMTGTDSCKAGSLELDSEDLLCASQLKGKLKKNDEVLLVKINDETYMILEKVVEL